MAEVYTIGQSEQGRNIYMVRLALGENEQDKPLIMITGGVHAREFAGNRLRDKILNDTLIKRRPILIPDGCSNRSSSSQYRLSILTGDGHQWRKCQQKIKCQRR